ncbi:MAG: homoserine dehydrogenase, partial [Kiloniellales bacterium]|nr:homoserine dehydrogenase [Kiloniellales bacterium]
ETGRDFEAALKEAQELGFAEADPSFDIDGVDAAHKLSILAALAFGTEVDFENVYVEGIRKISAFDIAAAEELGFRIKLLGVASSSDKGIEQRVHPCMVHKGTPIAAVEGVLNAVVAEGNFVGSIMVQGPGAGAGPTASAVVGDLVDLARGNRLPAFTLRAEHLRANCSRSMAEHVGSYYMRLTVLDQPGVIAEVSAVLRDAKISMESMLQHGRADGAGKPVQVVITTHETEEAAMLHALEGIAACSAVLQPPVLIRIETI